VPSFDIGVAQILAGMVEAWDRCPDNRKRIVENEIIVKSASMRSTLCQRFFGFESKMRTPGLGY
jgi:hypothetical protein